MNVIGSVTATIVAVTLALSSCTSAPLVQPTTDAAPGEAVVIAVVDGDTIDVQIDGLEQRVRIIGMDSPEIGRDGQPSDCYAEEARNFLDDLLYEQTVQLEADPTQADVDTYGRLLRNVMIDGQQAALASITAGAAAEYTYDAAYGQQSAYVAAEAAAQSTGEGMWACP